MFNSKGKNNSKPPPKESQAVPTDIKVPKLEEVLKFESLKWDTATDCEISIQFLYRYAEHVAQDAVDWYLARKSSKSKWSRVLRLSAIVLATLGGLAPVISSIGLLAPGLEETGKWMAPLISQLGYLWLALAAACVATDKFFGFSSGWMRYIKTAQVIMRVLDEFRMDWAMLLAKHGVPASLTAPPPLRPGPDSPPTLAQLPAWEPFSSPPTPGQIPFGEPLAAAPTPEQIQLMIQRIKEFVIAVNGYVEQETLTWSAEFQSSLAEIERSVKTQEQASKPGAIDVTVTNGMDTEAGFQVILDGMIVAHIRGTRHQIGYVPPGHHKISVTGVIKGKTLDASELVNVEPGTIAKVTLALPVEEAQP